MKLKDLLEQLGTMIGLPGLGLVDGSCRLIFDGALPVDVEEGSDEHEVHILSVLGPLPAEGSHEAACYRRLLQANHFGMETGGMTLSLVPSEGQFFLCGTVPLPGITVAVFSKILARFAREAHRWVLELEAMAQKATSPTGEAPLQDTSGFIRV
jgi:hypothetical protein